MRKLLVSVFALLAGLAPVPASFAFDHPDLAGQAAWLTATSPAGASTAAGAGPAGADAPAGPVIGGQAPVPGLVKTRLIPALGSKPSAASRGLLVSGETPG